MNFLVDAHIPRRLARWLHEAGHDVVHTYDLPLGNRTPDSVVNERSLHERRAVITKDEDFVDPFCFIVSRTNCCWYQQVTLEMLNWNFCFTKISNK